MDKNANSETIAGSLRAHRARKDISQYELANATGFNQVTISAWERDAGLSVKNAWALADFYGISLDDLVGRTRAKE